MPLTGPRMLTGIRHRAEPSQTKGRLAFTSALSSRVLVETPKARAFSAKRFVRSISSAPVATAVVAGSGPAGMRQDGSSDFQLGEGADFLRRKRSCAPAPASKPGLCFSRSAGEPTRAASLPGAMSSLKRRMIAAIAVGTDPKCPSSARPWAASLPSASAKPVE